LSWQDFSGLGHAGGKKVKKSCALSRRDLTRKTRFLRFNKTLSDDYA
jgi:hypothetical protein